MNERHPLLEEELSRIAALDLPWEKLDGATVAVTGAGGLVGSYLMRALDAARWARGLKLDLVALCRSPERTRAQLRGVEKLHFAEYDATKPLTSPLRADYVLHAAGNAHPLAFSRDPVGTMQASVLGTMRLLEQLRETGGRFLLFSTGEIYGERPGLPDGFDEHSFGSVDPMTPRACYPEGKRAAEALCAAYAAQYGVDALAARLTYVYGASITETNSRADAQFLRKALAGEDIVLKSDGSQVRSYCYAADAASALLTLMLRGEAAEAYNVANPYCAVSIRQYAETLVELAGVRVRFELPPEAERRGYSKVTRAILNPAKLMSLGWRAQYDLREGLRRTLEISRPTGDAI